ncbi:DUF5691 domain-containing protein [Nocardiopsis sp. EMB25]|uniref:DUF5691 domain-containing protein n=1 Tax=Nocardiopsis sp. EMB25 TaxID=2835867 RepID=UPI0022837E95|nr:DUF5691 domain-containing protein [Nocardiopsis sp. EMB25]MCY9786935.1 DUF5691 domain-containing protein [Nocardiopsis sp. EMB25]
MTPDPLGTTVPAPLTPDPPAPADSWDRLVSTALVGTARRAVPPTPDLPETPSAEGAEALLDRAALATVRRAAGYAPGTAEPVTPDPGGEPARIEGAAAHRLSLILAQRPELLPEWLELVAASGREVDRANIPALLERGERDSRLRPAIAAAVGTRGRWLAGLNDRWAYVTAETLPGDAFVEQDWADGGPSERRRALAVLRATDPDAARALLEAEWDALSRAEWRRLLLDTFSVGPVPGDAAFLDRVLDDKAANVRGLALSLLTRLPGSAHADRLRGYVREHARLGVRGELVVDDVAATRTDVLRDLALVVPEASRSGEVFERTWSLITHAPLDMWTDLFDTTPGEVFAAADAAREVRLRDAFGNAIGLQGDPEWARAVIGFLGQGLVGQLADTARGREAVHVEALLGVLPAEERCAAALAAARDRSRAKTRDADLAHLAQAVGAPWNRDLCELFLDHLGGPAPKHGRSPSAYRSLCDLAAERLRPEHLASLPEAPPRGGAEADAFLRLRELLRFRLDMHKEL